MREILFRGKQKDTKEWVYGNLFRLLGNSYICYGTTCYIPYLIEVIPETVGQYTGLTDKNGRKIFEGDIVRYGDGLYRVVFEQRNGMAYFGIAISEIETWYFANNVSAKQMEVIGNIYDNPELMEVKKNG